MPINQPPPAGEERPDDEPLDPWMKGVMDAAGLPHWEDEAGAPPLDHEAIRRHAARETQGAEGQRVGQLIDRFRSWHEAYLAQLAERARAEEAGDQPS